MVNISPQVNDRKFGLLLGGFLCFVFLKASPGSYFYFILKSSNKCLMLKLSFSRISSKQDLSQLAETQLKQTHTCMCTDTPVWLFVCFFSKNV